MQILLIEPDIRLRDMFSLNLTQSLGADVIPQDDAKEAWAMIELLEPAIVIANDKVGSENTIDFLIQKLEKNKKNIPIISIGLDIVSSSKLLTILPQNTTPEALATAALALIKRKQKKLNDKIKEENEKDQEKNFRPVPLNLFTYFAEVPFDIFIRLKRGKNFQFLKRINAKEGYDLDMIKSYAKKKVTHLYIEKPHYNKFTSIVNKRFKELLSDIHTASKSKEEIQEYVLDQLTETGFNDSNLQLAQESISKINSKIERSDSKLGLLTEIYNSQLGYRFRRSYMISVIGSLMIKNIDWGESVHSEYLTMAAYVHDMFLESDEEMGIGTDHEFEQAFLNKERDRVENHAQLAADKIKTNDQVPAEVEKIVRQHHGSHAGQGYPAAISPQVSKLSTLFIAAEEFSVAILNSPKAKINLNSVFKEIVEKHSTNKEIPKCLEAIKICLVKKK